MKTKGKQRYAYCVGVLSINGDTKITEIRMPTDIWKDTEKCETWLTEKSENLKKRYKIDEGSIIVPERLNEYPSIDNYKYFFEI